jgi:hypothetical protein
MKGLLFYGILVLYILVSCERNNRDIFLKIGSDLEYNFSDIELYDTSTNILYFKTEHDEFKHLDKGIFIFVDNGDMIYSGSLWPGYSSLGPSGPFIMSPSMYGDYALRIDNWHLDKPDIRKDPRMIQILKQHNLLHSGLAILSSSVEITTTQLTFRFTISNQDKSDLLILDINKTGPNLFHYFTNGLYIHDLAHNEVFSSTIQHQVPDPWNTWKTEWLSEIKSGDSKEFTINYPLENPLSSGEYIATFEFPGLGYQVKKDQLYQGESRIWLGDVSLNKRIFIP